MTNEQLFCLALQKVCEHSARGSVVYQIAAQALAEPAREYAIQQIQGVAMQSGLAVVYGAPAIYPWLAEDNPAQHNCDAMGCGTHHVLARIVPDEEQSHAEKRAEAERESRREPPHPRTT